MEARNTKQNQIKSTYYGKYSLSTSSRCHSRWIGVVEYSGPRSQFALGKYRAQSYCEYYMLCVTFVLCAFPTCFA